MNKAVCLFVLLAAIAVSAELSYFPGRSAKLVYEPVQRSDDGVVFVVGKESTSESLKETELADLISYSIGGPLVKSPVTNFASSSPLVKDRANLLFVVNGVGKATLDKLGDMKVFKQSGSKLAIESEYFPSDTVASLTSMLTGFGPSFHGIVNKQWVSSGSKVTAYSSSTSVPSILSISDIVSQTFGGQPLTVSATNCPMMAKVLNSNIYGNSELLQNRIAVSLDKSSGSYKSSVDSIEFSVESLLSELSNRKFSLRSKTDKVQVDISRNLVIVELNNILATFDLSLPQDLHFFTELQMISNVLSAVTTNYPELVNDNIPDLYNMAMTSIMSLEDENKISSALLLLDSVLVELIESYEAVYGRLSVQIVFMGTSPINQVKSVMKNSNFIDSVYNSIKEFIITDKDTFYSMFPMIYVKNEQLVLNTLANDNLINYNNYLSASCMTNPQVLGQVKQVSATTLYGTSADYQDAAIFHIVLWGSIVLVLAVFAAIFAIYAMDTGSTDTLLYRSSAPNAAPKAR